MARDFAEGKGKAVADYFSAMLTSGFTSAARQEAERLGVELCDGERLLRLLSPTSTASSTSSTRRHASLPLESLQDQVPLHSGGNK
jgi:restriction endonuclease Mrr